MSVEQVAKHLMSELTVGMARAEVEKKLKAYPVSFVYVTRSELQMIGGVTTADGKPISGRFDVTTTHERNFLTMKFAVIFVELDHQQRVAALRIETHGFQMDDASG